MPRVSLLEWFAFRFLNRMKARKNRDHSAVNLILFSLFQVTDRRCTDERWVRDLLVDGCLTYNGLYWCMCSTDLCNSGDFNSIRGRSKNQLKYVIIERRNY